jgi:hypothetical protein
LLRSRQAKDSNTEQDGIVLFGMNPKIDGGGVIRYIPYNLFNREFFASSDANATQRDRVHQRPICEVSYHLCIVLLVIIKEIPQVSVLVPLAWQHESYLFWKDPLLLARLPNPRAALSVAFSS